MSILSKYPTLGNKHLREIQNETLAKKINEERTFEAKIEDPLDEIVKIIDVPDIENKKSMSNRLLRRQAKLKQIKNLLSMILSTYRLNLTE